MASFQKRGKTWQYTVSNYVNGVYKPIRKGGFKTKKEAQVAAADVEQRLHQGTYRYAKGISFSEYFDEWVEVYKKPHIQPSTYEAYLTTSDMIKEHFGHTPLQQITKKEYQQFLNKYGSIRSMASVKLVHIHVRSAVLDAIDDQLLFTDFTRNVVLHGQVATKKPEEKFLDYEEAILLIRHLEKLIEERNSLTDYVLLIGLLTGMRFGEIVGLTWEAINEKDRTILVDKTWDCKFTFDFSTTKTENERIIHIDRYTLNVLKKLKECSTPNDYGLLFFSPLSNSKVVGNRSCNMRLKRHCETLGINQITVHGLRHTHASILIYKGVSIYYVSERLGHSTIQTTISTYTHLLKKLKEKEVDQTLQTIEQMVQG